MGCVVSILHHTFVFQGDGNLGKVVVENSSIETMLEEQRLLEGNRKKILLLGAGESGKSTVIKQIKLIWNLNRSSSAQKEMELRSYREAIRRNCIEAMRTLIEAAPILDIDLIDISLECNTILEYDKNQELTPELGDSIAKLWRHHTIAQIFQRRNEFWNMDGTPYYLDEVQRIAAHEYSPTEEDIIMARVRTTGIVVSSVADPPRMYEIVDVGGQRSERKKWIHCFDNVDAIIFLEGLSGYNQVLFEDGYTTRMKESLSIFTEVVRNPLFKNIPIFVFLNKKDLFEDMIPIYPLRVCFPEYQGPDGEVRPALDYIEGRYRAIMEEFCPRKDVHIQIVAARVRMDMKIAFGEVKERLREMDSSHKRSSTTKDQKINKNTESIFSAFAKRSLYFLTTTKRDRPARYR